ICLSDFVLQYAHRFGNIHRRLTDIVIELLDGIEPELMKDVRADRLDDSIVNSMEVHLWETAGRCSMRERGIVPRPPHQGIAVFEHQLRFEDASEDNDPTFGNKLGDFPIRDL